MRWCWERELCSRRAKETLKSLRNGGSWVSKRQSASCIVSRHVSCPQTLSCLAAHIKGSPCVRAKGSHTHVCKQNTSCRGSPLRRQAHMHIKGMPYIYRSRRLPQRAAGAPRLAAHA